MCQYHELARNWNLALEVIKRLRERGHEALLVGGCVRDHLLGIPSEDCDVATSATPRALIDLFADECKPVGIDFGVVLIARDKVKVEVSTYRTESGYADHRHPAEVRFSTREVDAQRRDFTVNALYWDPYADVIYDHVGGRADLERRLLRAVGDPDVRFAEDALRVLRGVRFAASLDFTFESQTWEALCRHVQDLIHISAERIRDELLRGLMRGNPGRFLDLLDQCGALQLLLPEVAAMKGVPQPPEFHPEGDVFVHTKLVLEKLAPIRSPTLALAALLHDVGKPVTATWGNGRMSFPNHDKVGAEIADEICRRLRLSKPQREAVVAMVKRHMMFISLKEMRPARRLRFLTAPTIEEELELHRADCEASHGKLENFFLAQEERQRLRERLSAPALPPPLVRGDDLKNTLGIPPGPHYKEILTAVHDAQLEGRLRNKEEALSLARQLYETLKSSKAAPPISQEN